MVYKYCPKLSLSSMGPRKRGVTKRKREQALEIESERENPEDKEAEEKEERKRRKDRGNKKYIGAHVGIQGEA